MISLEEFREALGDEADKMTEEEILKLREHLDKEAELYFQMWRDKINEKID